MTDTSLNTYWIVIRIDLEKPLSIKDAERYGISPSATGYYQKFGVTQASGDSACQLVIDQISLPGILDRDESTVSLMDVNRLDPKVLEKSGDWTRPGIWYKSGRIFFASERKPD